MFPGFYLHFSLYETYILVKLPFNYSAHIHSESSRLPISYLYDFVLGFMLFYYLLPLRRY